MASYSLFSNIVTSLGRVGFGIEQSMSSRYIAYSVFFIIGSISLLILVLGEYKQGKLFKYKFNITTFILGFLISILFVFYFQSFNNSISTIKHTRYERLYGKSCLMLMNVVKDEDCLEKKMTPEVENLKRIANKINGKGWFNFKIIPNEDLSNFLDLKDNQDEKYGFFDNVIKEENNKYIANGWAILPHRKEKSDVVILAYKNPDKSYQPFALAKVDTLREDVANNLKEANYLSSGWQLEFSKRDIFDVSGDKIPESLELTAWSFDTNTGKTFQLSNTHILP